MRLAEEDRVGRTYVGRHHGGADTVDIYGPEGVKPLGDRWNDSAGEFGWGKDFTGSVALARALLSDAFGVAATETLAANFAADVVSRFPPEGFAVGAEEVRGWGTPPAARTLTGNELVEHLGGIALADEDDSAEFLSRVVERCWDEHSLRH
jgi:hypothetical protein